MGLYRKNTPPGTHFYKIKYPWLYFFCIDPYASNYKIYLPSWVSQNNIFLYRPIIIICRAIMPLVFLGVISLEIILTTVPVILEFTLSLPIPGLKLHPPAPAFSRLRGIFPHGDRYGGAVWWRVPCRWLWGNRISSYVKLPHSPRSRYTGFSQMAATISPGGQVRGSSLSWVWGIK